MTLNELDQVLRQISQIRKKVETHCKDLASKRSDYELAPSRYMYLTDLYVDEDKVEVVLSCYEDAPYCGSFEFSFTEEEFAKILT